MTNAGINTARNKQNSLTSPRHNRAAPCGCPKDYLAARGVVSDRGQVLAWLNAGRVHLLLDGVNEVAEPGAEPHGLAELDTLPQRFPFSRVTASAR